MFTPKLTLLLPSMLLCLGSQNVSAGPMGFKDAYMVMGDFNNNWREAFINYAVTPRDAFGVSATYMRSDDKTRTRTLEEVTYTKLFHRWNMPHAQANLWLLGGIGALQGENARIGSDDKFDNIMITPGVQFDYETTRVYFQATHRLYRASGINHDYNSVRAGFSFYETDYDKTQPWLIVEARNMNGLSDKVEITPMLRLINKSFFLEAGVNNFAQPRFNFMYLF
ncbi:MAG: hypothetical protein B7Y16_04055 [Methylotenera sp. 24-45-7]|jgi:hypothetical protein|nr:MAG: hypothetical protein B7Y72_07680 [Mehylophilales bacterium 35-46-6]OYZ40938.1 MAG: hypothetical protein B7Y16_04055 [Methylotenera sp. 24-45-7]OZA08150.1 MAG: hypothetical protein B7X97_07285 [Methylotenera sp. 17-45-7]OZA53454.1 MAG: hypothetical protein B7X73_04350 [Methylophilales bacterium 39-45-7]HQS37564.1 hypothetical protein [Methylotenera sp.]